MKIAMIGAKGVPAEVGGIERHVEELGARLATRGFSVTAYSRPWYTNRAPWSVRVHRSIRVVTIPCLRTKHFDTISHTILATLHAMREGFDVYHFHGVGPALVAWLPRLFRPRSRVITTFHCVDRKHAKWGTFARAVLTVGEWAACAFPHETITVGETLAAYCSDRYGAATACIPNGVTAPVAPANADAVLASFGLTPSQYLLVVTRLVPHKHVHTVITAFRQLVRERVEFRSIHLAIVGASLFTSDYADELRIIAGGDPMVQFLGAQQGSTLAALFTNARAFLHASTSEGLPIAVLEAAAAGLVPLVSDIPEHREVIARIGGFTFRTGDARDCRTQLEVLLAASPSLPAIGARIRDAVLRAYDWDMLAARVGERYHARPSRRTHAHPVMRLQHA